MPSKASPITASDYFIHKNLEGFLRRELEFYLKDQVLHPSDLEGDLAAKQRTLRVVRQLAEEVIQFLAQNENVQKRPFEKRKFVLKTDYLVPIQNVPRDLYREIIANEAQLKAWKELFAVEPKKVNEKFLAEHPTLVVNTAHFGEQFKERLLAGFDDLDEATDGLLIHSENYQALRFLEPKQAGGVKSTYIDPPYNTGSDDFIYKDNYRSSSWLAMMRERLHCCRNLLRLDGCIFISIDDHEVGNLRPMMDFLFLHENSMATAVWKRTVSKLLSGGEILAAHEYLLTYQNSPQFDMNRLEPEDKDEYKNPDNDPRGPYKKQKFERTLSGARPTMTYTIETPASPMTRTWSGPPETYKKALADNRIVFSASGIPYYKQFLSEMSGLLPASWWQIEGGYNQGASFDASGVVWEQGL